MEAKPPASGAEEGAPDEPEPPESEAPHEREKVQPLSVPTPEARAQARLERVLRQPRGPSKAASLEEPPCSREHQQGSTDRAAGLL